MYTEPAIPESSGSVQAPAHVLARKVWAAFAFTFVLSRILVFLIMSGRLPDIHSHFRGTQAVAVSEAGGPAPTPLSRGLRGPGRPRSASGGSRRSCRSAGRRTSGDRPSPPARPPIRARRDRSPRRYWR